jgi:hypothetical protein
MKNKVLSALPALLLLAAGMAYSAPADRVMRTDEKAVNGAFDGAVALLRAQPAKTPEAAIVTVLKYMRGAVSYQNSQPAQRGPHQWPGRLALANGSVNGCVEAAKVFFELFRAAYPGYKAAYLDSFNSVGEGGHAVPVVKGSGGQDYIVDTAAFSRLPGHSKMDDNGLSDPVDIRPEHKGRILQFRDQGDVFVEKKDGKYHLTVYPYRRVFDVPPLDERVFDTLAGLNDALDGYSAADKLDFRYLQDNGYILPFLDAERSGFLYAGSAGALSKHVIYGCYTTLPEKDDAEKAEPAARENYKKTGKAGIDWSKAPY